MLIEKKYCYADVWIINFFGCFILFFLGGGGVGVGDFSSRPEFFNDREINDAGRTQAHSITKPKKNQKRTCLLKHWRS